MTPFVKNLVVYAGEDYSNTTYTGIVDANNSGIDFTPYAVLGQFAEDVQSNTIYSFVANGTSNSGVVLTMNATTTANLIPQRYYYSVVGTLSSKTSKLMHGILTVYPRIA